MKSKSHLSTKDLSTLRKNLPHGGIKRISETTKLDQSTVSKVLKGVFNNDTVIECALEIIEETKSKSESLKQRIGKL